MNINNANFLFLLIILLKSDAISQIIGIPFKFDILGDYRYYNSEKFLYQYFKREINLELNIGTPAKKILTKINQDSSCFLFKQGTSIKNDYKYFPNNSLSFNVKDNSLIDDIYEIAEDIFTFQTNNNTLLFYKEKNKNITNNESFTPVIGLNIPLISNGNICPNFILDLKNKKIINKLIWSIKFNYKYDGEFIIGDELSVYDSRKYPESQYDKIYLSSKYIINFDTVFIPEISYRKSSDLIIKKKFNITDAHININSGVIIGTKEYKDYIDVYFFNYLVNRSICKVDIINYNINNTNEIPLNNDSNYYVYSCYGRQFTGQTSMRYASINYYEEFPKLIFSSKKIEYNFEFTNNNLFEIIDDKYYFLIIFKTSDIINNNNKEVWQLGEPFYRKYTFSMDPDSKTIGFYTGKEKSKDNKNNETNNNNNDTLTNNKNQDDNNETKINVIKYGIIVIIVIGLIIIAYCAGVTVREGRRKRANELKDDNYEYLAGENENIN